MYPVSNAVKALYDAENKQVLRITGMDKNGAAINITDANVVIDSFSMDASPLRLNLAVPP